MTLHEEIQQTIRKIDRPIIWECQYKDLWANAKCTHEGIKIEMYYDEYGNELIVNGKEIHYNLSINEMASKVRQLIPTH